MFPRWDSLARETRLLILKTLMQDGCPLSYFVTVSQEWQTGLEQHILARIKLTPSLLADFATSGFSWSDDYDCAKCATSDAFRSAVEWEEMVSEALCYHHISSWHPSGDLTLDISIYSPRDSEHWFKYLTFLVDTPSDMLECGGTGLPITTTSKADYLGLPHGWFYSSQYLSPPRWALCKVFWPIIEEGPFDSEQLGIQWLDQPLLVPAVTSLFIRQQNRKLRSLAHMLARVTNEEFQQASQEIGNFETSINSTQPHCRHGVDLTGCESVRSPNPYVSRMVALASIKLEHLAASFITDANQFFKSAFWWPNLTTKLLAPSANPIEIRATLRDAMAAAMNIPQLKTMEIWNRRKELAALFKYQSFRKILQATIIWRGTWKLTMELPTIEAWEEGLDESTIKPHMIWPVSLQYILGEQEALEGVRTM
ncbi:hypothetical protein QBC36DRAFT_345818 [Triangularia setosa]|uniref:DUF6546 domain-containing protein n=1 Tax=Triangularia setosa TaxID=2587417 RepID=A0AAN6WBE0_9PEZI|nr:hypothetical protein QBC36DRAFT_345818 [Podospora setosa]